MLPISNVANVQMLPVSNVASFQLWAVRARGRGQKRQECRFPEVRRVGVRGRVRPRFVVWVWEDVGGT